VILLLIGAGLISGIGAAAFLNLRQATQRHETAFAEIRAGMSEADGDRLLKLESRTKEPSGQIWWDDRLIEVSPNNVGKEVWFSPPTQFLFRISYAIAFDKDGKVIGKHRYD